MKPVKFRVIDNKKVKDITGTDDFFLTPDGELCRITTDEDGYFIEELNEKFYKRKGNKFPRYSVHLL